MHVNVCKIGTSDYKHWERAHLLQCNHGVLDARGTQTLAEFLCIVEEKLHHYYALVFIF